MKPDCHQTRRAFLAGLASTTAFGMVQSASAAALAVTPAQNEGPYYPFDMPLDRDNDLIQVAGRPGTAKGEIVHLFGRVLDENGRPVVGARVEIWQCDVLGHYHHVGRVGEPNDPDFQGYGITAVGSDGTYRFRTIKPVPYASRTPHIHFAVAGNGIQRLTTQMYIMGHPDNDGDFLYNNVGDRKARDRVSVNFTSAPQIAPDAIAGNFDLVLGLNTLSR